MAIPPAQSTASNTVPSSAVDPAAGPNNPANPGGSLAPTQTDSFSVLRGHGNDIGIGVGGGGPPAEEVVVQAQMEAQSGQQVKEQAQLQLEQQMQELSRLQTGLTDTIKSVEAAESGVARNVK